MSIIALGRRPTIPEIRQYYARPDILNELLQGMQRWHVRYVPGSERQSWLYTVESSELQSLLNRALDAMENDPQYTDYPYFRINHARHDPAKCWDESTLRGHDFVIEKDSTLWQECFEAMLPVMDILEYFGVHYWLKYSGHHSLHLVIPAEVFPQTIRGVPLNTCYEAIYHRLMIFLNRRANQYYNEHNRHCPPGTNMPYSVNEDTGLVNLPLQRLDLSSFRPWHASIYLVQPKDFWRIVPEHARGQATSLLDDVLKPTRQQKLHYTAMTRFLQLDENKFQETGKKAQIVAQLISKTQALTQISSTNSGERLIAAWTLMILALPEAVPQMKKALTDECADVRWFTAEGLARCGPLSILDDLVSMQPDDMAGSCLIDFCLRHGAASIPVLIQALRTQFRSPYTSLPYDKALERIGKNSIPYLEDLQKHKDSNIRHIAANILQRISGMPAVEDVLDQSQSYNRKSYTAGILGWYDDQRVYKRVKALTTDFSNDRVRRDAVKSLLWNDHPETDEILRNALQDPSKKIRHWAERYLKLLAQLKPLL